MAEMAEATSAIDEAVIALEERPTGDFIDGYLAGLATVNAALAGAPPNSFFYSFDWIGDGSEPRETSLTNAFQAAEGEMNFEISAAPDWKATVDGLARKWLARDLPAPAADALAREFVELIDAFLAQQPAEVLEVRPVAASGAPANLGAAYDHLMFETLDGRLMLEFSMDG